MLGDVYKRQGMGCHLYVRHKVGVIKALFMHQDSWGQYGPTSDDTPKLNKFIENLEEVNKLEFQPSLHSLPSSPERSSPCMDKIRARAPVTITVESLVPVE